MAFDFLAPTLKKKWLRLVRLMRHTYPGRIQFAEPDHEPAIFSETPGAWIPKELFFAQEGSGSLTELISDP